MRNVRSWLRVAVVSCAVVSVSGCTKAVQVPQASERNVITRDEFESARVSTAYDVIVRFRSNFLRSRGKNSILLKQPQQATVFLDQVEYGAINSLRSIPASTIAEIRFIEGWDAMTKYGSNHVSGVIQIYTRYQ